MVYMAQKKSQPQRRAAIAAEIRAELARQNLTYAALAKAIGMSPSTLGRRLEGLRPFYLEELEAIAQFLGLKLSEFTARTDAA
jgi:transcriptional regulator with XRE-family HTH domain